MTRRSRRNLGPVAAAYATNPLPPPRTAWTEASWCVVDLELSGLDPARHEILSFGAISIDHGRVQLAGATTGLVRPTGPVEEASIRVHGLRPVDLEDAAPLPEAIEPLIEAITGRVLVAHAARIETAFLARALRAKQLRLRARIADTNVIGQLWLGERDGRAPRELSLSELAYSLGLPVHTPHDALGDALTTAQAFIALATHLSVQREQTVESLTRADRKLQAMRTYPTHT